MTDTVRLSLAEAEALCVRAAMGVGASEEAAHALARAAVAAEAEGQPNVGLAHMVDYVEAMVSGRMDGRAEPVITWPAPALILSNAGKGAAHTGFDRAFADLVSTARTFGLAAFAQRNAYTCGALGWFVSRLASEGLVGLAAANTHAMITVPGVTKPVYGTNPLAFAAPVGAGPPLVLDQASSATAFVNIRKATQEGRALPQGWAIDAEGRPTTDPAAAMKGALLAFGGERGANVALMVEVLAAGLTGANWSLDAPAFNAGAENPGVGMFVLALSPALLAPDFSRRLAAQLGRLSDGYGVHIPGRAKARARERAEVAGLDIPREVYERLAAHGTGFI